MWRKVREIKSVSSFTPESTEMSTVVHAILTLGFDSKSQLPTLRLGSSGQTRMAR